MLNMHFLDNKSTRATKYIARNDENMRNNTFISENDLEQMKFLRSTNNNVCNSIDFEEYGRKLDSLWGEIGLSDDEKNKEVRKLCKDVVSIFSSAIKKLEDERDKLYTDCNYEFDEYNKIARILDRSNVELSFPENISLRDKYSLIHERFSKVNEIYQNNLKMFNSSREKIKQYLQDLDVDAQTVDEFTSTFNEGYSDSLLEKYLTKVSELESLHKDREEKMRIYKSHIQEIALQLDLKVDFEASNIMSRNSLSSRSMSYLEEYHAKLQEMKERNFNRLREILSEIVYCWEYLNIDKQEQEKNYNKYSTISDKVVEASEAELRGLKVQVINRQEERIQEMLQCVGNQIEIDVNTERTGDFEKDFYKFKIIIENLEKIEKHGIFKLCAERNEILNELGSLENRTKRKKCLEKGEMKEKYENENVIRRKKYKLSRVERKLKLQLIQFKEEFKGEIRVNVDHLIDSLDNIILSDFEILSVLSNRKDSAKQRKSVLNLYKKDESIRKRVPSPRRKTDYPGMYT